MLLFRLLTTIAKLLGPDGTRGIVAESLLMKQQLVVINRSRKRAPNLSVFDRFLLGFWTLFLSPSRILRVAVIIRPPTLLKVHEALKKHGYRLLYSSRRKGKPGPKGPSKELITSFPRSCVGMHTDLTTAYTPQSTPVAPNSFVHSNIANVQARQRILSEPDSHEYTLSPAASFHRSESIRDVYLPARTDRHDHTCVPRSHAPAWERILFTLHHEVQRVF